VTDVLAAITARLRPLVGVTTTEHVGVLQRRDFLRFARAAGDEAYLARAAAGGADVCDAGDACAAPVLYLPGILHWSPPDESELRPDGLARRDAPGVEDEAVNVMHGGQTIEVHEPAREGMHVTVERTLRRAERKEGRVAPFLVVVTESRFVDEGARLLSVVADTILVVPR
jgi:hypothetical protein